MQVLFTAGKEMNIENTENTKYKAMIISDYLDDLEYLCKNHDKYYDYSDDHSVWKRGEAEHKAICNIRDKILKEFPEYSLLVSEILEEYLGVN